MQISVVGCGWLGKPLALTLKNSGYPIVATTRSPQKCNQLSNLGLEAVKFELGEDLKAAAIHPIFASQLLILNIPVGRKSATEDNFVEKMQALIKYAASKQIKKLIFISTTSVYGEQNKTITEQSPTTPTTLSGAKNLAIESLVTATFPENSTIIRLSGLVNHSRHPVNYLSGKSNLQNPNAKVNLIHQDDVINAIRLVIQKEIWGQRLHLSAIEHPTRKDYYTWSAAQLNLPPPGFIASDKTASGKEINPAHTLEQLGLTLKYPSPYDMIEL